MPRMSENTKQRMVLLKNEGKNYSEISLQLFTEGISVTRQTVAPLIKRFNETQSLEYRLSSGRLSKLHNVHLSFIEEKMQENDELTSIGNINIHYNVRLLLDNMRFIIIFNTRFI